jgi:hypothetical protein
VVNNSKKLALSKETLRILDGQDLTDVVGGGLRDTAAASPGSSRSWPGSEWLYIKLFTGPATADQVLRRIASVLTWALTAGGDDQWFFLRYGDPDWHLRLRIHGAPTGCCTRRCRC